MLNYLILDLLYCATNNYITYIAAMRLYYSQHWTAALSSGVAALSSMAQLQVYTGEQRQRCEDARLTKSRRARSKQLLMMPTDVANQI